MALLNDLWELDAFGFDRDDINKIHHIRFYVFDMSNYISAAAAIIEKYMGKIALPSTCGEWWNTVPQA